MKFQARPGVSVIIATLLLIAIAVAASILVYVFVTGLAGSLTVGGGQQTTERLQMQSYNFQLSPQACACVGQILQIFLLNSGSSSTTISTIYYDGNLLTVTAPFTTAAVAINTIGYSAAASPLAYTATAATLVNDLSSAGTCTTTNGPAASMCFTTATPKTTYNAGDVGQIVIPLSPAAVAGTSHTVKVVSTTGATYVFSVTVGRSG